MNDPNFNNLGEQISKTIQNVLNNREVNELKNSIQGAMHRVSDSISQADFSRRDTPKERPVEYYHAPVQKAYQRPQAAAYRPYQRRGSVSGVLCLVFGFLGGVPLGAALLVLLVIMLAAGQFAGVLPVVSGVLAFLEAGCIALITAGFALRRRLKRFDKYHAVLQGRKFCTIEELAQATGYKPAFVARDLKKMIAAGLFPDGHLDEEGTCLMTDMETYQQYLTAQENYRQRQRDEQRERELWERDPDAAALSKMVEEGSAYIRKIKEANDALPQEDISQKLDKLEEISGKIFRYVEQHPQKLPDIRKFMCYYMPITLKLVTAYQDFEQNSMSGGEIEATKAEIRGTLGTINEAFENLLQNLYQHDALDISTDISALETMLAQEGLTGEDFKRKNNEGGN